MHPAISVIFFTVTSGAGYGLLLLFCVFSLAGVLPQGPWFGGGTVFAALTLASIGLLSSTFHLGHPERAWRALSQWRTSWLSREGVAAILTFGPSGLLFLMLAFDLPNGPLYPVAAVFSAVGALIVTSCTGMIYASLRPIRQWHHPLVLPLYHAFSLKTGTLLLMALCAGFGTFIPALWGFGIFAIIGTWALKLLYWHAVDADISTSTPQTATGLSGQVRLLEGPHTEDNYLLKEMGYRVGRKHGAKLRRIALTLGAVVPAFLVTASWMAEGTPRTGFAALAALAALAGAVVERWLFFAQARHTVTLYYGTQDV